MHPSEPQPAYNEEPRSNAEDVALIRRMCDADESALGALYDQWVRRLYSHVLHLLRNSDEAEDVVEETFWQAWRRACAYEPARGAVSTWLFTIGRRKALDRIRARRRIQSNAFEHAVGSLEEIVSPHAGPQDDAEHADLRRQLKAAIDELPVEQREVIDLAYYGGMTHAEIATATAAPLGTVKTRMRLALQKLRQPLSAHREGDA